MVVERVVVVSVSTVLLTVVVVVSVTPVLL